MLVFLYCISIHALREEGDDYRLVRLAKFDEFLSTPSARRATTKGMDATTPDIISIHALREEGDQEELPEEPKKEISIHALREEGDR